MSRSLRLLVVTGMSGAGKTTALKLLEDLGYEAVDNLPVALLRPLAAPDPGDSGARLPPAIAVGIDARTRDFAPDDVLARLEALKAQDAVAVRLIFLDAEDAALQSRFTATRRRHPLALDRPIMDGIARERALLWPLREQADLVIDTTGLSLPDFRNIVAGHFALAQSPQMAISLVSFSFRHGLPRQADLVFDARFLRNPFYDPALRSLTGRDEPVARFVSADPAFAPFVARLEELILSLIPSFKREGKTYLTIAVGCTGGRHRSVCVSGWLAEALERNGHAVTLAHRDIDRGDQ